MSGVAFPYWQPASMMDGSTWKRWYVRIRRDHPDSDGKKKYVSPYGDRRHLHFPPCPERFSDPNVPIVLVESEKADLALLAWSERTGRSLLPIGMGGCWGWHGKVGLMTTSSGERVPEHGALPDLNICRDGRETFVLLDANANSNPQVARARASLLSHLERQGAVVKVLELPHGEWNGPDDYIGGCGDEAMA
jgi:Domain of unknown function (DUF3854)